MRSVTLAFGTLFLVLAVALAAIMVASHWVAFSICAIYGLGEIDVGCVHNGVAEICIEEPASAPSNLLGWEFGGQVSVEMANATSPWPWWPPVHCLSIMAGSTSSRSHVQIALWLPLLGFAIVGALLRQLGRTRSSVPLSTVSVGSVHRTGRVLARWTRHTVRATGWIAILLTAMIIVHATVSRSRSFEMGFSRPGSGDGIGAGLRNGDAQLALWSHSPDAGSTQLACFRAWYTKRQQSSMNWWPPLSTLNSSAWNMRQWGVSIRAWIACPLFLTLGGGLLFVTRHGKAPTDACPTCGYSLTGLPANAACPECGAARPSPQSDVLLTTDTSTSSST